MSGKYGASGHTVPNMNTSTILRTCTGVALEFFWFQFLPLTIKVLIATSFSVIVVDSFFYRVIVREGILVQILQTNSADSEGRGRAQALSWVPCTHSNWVVKGPEVWPNIWWIMWDSDRQLKKRPPCSNPCAHVQRQTDTAWHTGIATFHPRQTVTR
jgi:hypothetical protein